MSLDLAGPAPAVLDAFASTLGLRPRVASGVVHLDQADAVSLLHLVDGVWSAPDEWVKIADGLNGAKAIAVSGSVAVFAPTDLSGILPAVSDGIRPGMWEVSVWVVSVSLSGRWSAVISGNSSGLASAGGSTDGEFSAKLEAVVNAAWDVSGEDTDAVAVTRGSLVVVEGSSGRWQSGESTPIPKASSSPYGVVRTEAYEFIDTGYICEIETWRTPEGLGLRLRPSVSEIIGQVGDAPIIARREVSTVGYLRDGEYLMLLGLDDSRSRAASPFVGVGSRRTASDAESVFILRARRVR